MADIKSAQKLLEDLPKSDPLKALQELASWVESVREQEEFRLDHQLAVLRLIDETARPFERKVTRDYFAATSLSTFQENRLWLGMNELFGQLAQAYFKVLLRYRNGDKGSSTVKAALPLVATRGISAVAGRLKCAAARYALVDPAMWGYLAEFYAHAESQGYLDEAVMLYAGSGINTSVRSEFASVLMWYASSASTLGRLHLHLAERLVSHLSKHFTVGSQREKGLFAFDPQHPGSPMRVSAETASQPGFRYLGVGDIQSQFESLLKVLERGIVPDAVNLGGVYEPGPVLEVARHLAECLSSSPPTRRNARHNIKVSLNVASGFSRLVERTDIGLDFGSDGSSTWEIENVSTSGFRCTLPAARMDGIAIGVLIGIRPERLDSWGVGIVRRLGRDAMDNLQVGVEILSNQVTGVVLGDQHPGEAQHALWLNSLGDDTGEARLLISPDTFSSSRSLHAQVGGKSYLLMPLELMERGEDYDLARYRKIEQDTSGGEEAY